MKERRKNTMDNYKKVEVTHYVKDMYGISQRDFEDTYRFTDNLEKEAPKR